MKRNWISMLLVSVLALSSIVAIPPADTAQAVSDGTPFDEAFEVPGTFQAEDFNVGDNFDAYFAHETEWITKDPAVGRTPDLVYRADAPRVDIYNDGTYRYVVSSNEQNEDSWIQGYVSEYLRYTIDYDDGNEQVDSTSWFNVSFSAKHVEDRATLPPDKVTSQRAFRSFITVLIDGVQQGATPAIRCQEAEGACQLHTYTLPKPVMLTEGEHVLTIELAGAPATYLDTITFAPADPPVTDPQIITSGLLSDDEVVVANIVVNTGSGGGCTSESGCADTSNTNDATGAIQDALDLAEASGGGIVYLPSGTYRIESSLTIPTNVVLRGNWKSPVSGEPENGTILAVVLSEPEEEESPVQLSGANSTVRDLSIWYPDQDEYDGTSGELEPIEAPAAILAKSCCSYVKNVTIYNAYIGVSFPAGSASLIDNVYGTVFKEGIRLDGDYEFSFVTNVFFDASIWYNAPSAITNKPNSTQLAAVKQYTLGNLTGVVLYKNDGLTVRNISVNDAYVGILTGANEAGGAGGSWGNMSNIYATVSTYGDKLNFVDRITQARGLHYAPPPNRKPADDTEFLIVTDDPYDAVPNDGEDDTEAIQEALNDLAVSGGTVFLPPGAYHIEGNLTVPEGVELRGSYDFLHAHENLDTTVLFAYTGRDAENPASATALITLSENSGIRGISVFYPEQGFRRSGNLSVDDDPGFTEMPWYIELVGELNGLPETIIHPYPYTIRSLGDNTWVKYVMLENSYYGMDFATHESDNFVISHVWMNAANRGIYVGGGSDNGWIEYAVTTYGSFFQSKHISAPHTYGYYAAKHYTHHNTEAVVVGNSSNIQLFAVNAFEVKTGILAINEGIGSGPQNLRIYSSVFDDTHEPHLTVAGGGSIYMAGLVPTSYTTGTNTNFARLDTTFTGTLNLYGVDSLGTVSSNVYDLAPGGTYNLYSENDLYYDLPVSINKPTVGNSVYQSESAGRATDGFALSKWAASTKNGSGAYTLDVDLGAGHTIGRWVVKHAAVAGDSPLLNTRDYKLQVSNNGTDFTDVAGTNASVSGNTENVTDLTLGTPAVGRYFRLHISDAGADDIARIAAFDLYTLPDNLALNKSATASAYVPPSPPSVEYSSGPNWAVDGSTEPASKWVSTAGTGPHWMMVDLGAMYDVSRWVVKHSSTGTGGLYKFYNTKTFELQTSYDGGMTFHRCPGSNSARVNNGSPPEEITDLTLETPCRGQYFRLYIENGTQDTYDQFARIQEFELYGTLLRITNLAANKKTDASHGASAGYLAVDGNSAGSSKWVGNADDCPGDVCPDKWLTVDLGEVRNITRWVVKHSNIDTLNHDYYNTSEFRLRYLPENEDEFEDVPGDNVSVAGNTAVMTNLKLGTPVKARYVQLLVSQGTYYGKPTMDEYARIQEFELYSEPNFAYNPSDNTDLYRTNSTYEGQHGYLALDGSTAGASKWVATVPAACHPTPCSPATEYWLMVDLKNYHPISRIVVKHASSDGSTSQHYNTQAFKIQFTYIPTIDGVLDFMENNPDRSPWGDVASVTANTDAVTEIILNQPVTARVFRLFITKGTSDVDPYDDYFARIQEFELYQ